MLFVQVTCLIILFLSTMEVNAASARSKQLSSLLFRSIADHTKLDLPMAKKLLSQFKSDDTIVGNVNDDIPILHHLLNLHRMSTSARDKADVLETFVAALIVGADPSTPYKSDPPLIFKAILLKEINVCQLISDSSVFAVRKMLHGQGRWSGLFFTHLYSTPSESIPLAKLLLHADTIVRDKGQSAMGGVDGVRKLLASASLGKPAVKSADLDLHSPAYGRILDTLGADNGGKIHLLDIIRSLDDVAGAVHRSVLSAAVSDASAAVRLVQVLTGLGTSSDASVYPMHRNALHFLCLSGGAVMLEQLRQFLLELRTSGSNSVGAAADEIKQDGTTATSTPPLDTTATSTECDSMVREALRTADLRGHTPVSYAAMRFSTASPIGDALRLLCLDLNLDLDQEVAHSRENGALHTPTAAPAKVTITTATTSENGGWRTTLLADAISSESGADPRILEVHTSALPSNKEFFNTYLNTGTPVIFRRTSGTAEDSVAATQKAFKKADFLASYGDVTVPAATIPYAGTFGKKQSLSTIREVANSQDSTAEVPLYTFCTPTSQWADKLLSDVPVPRSLLRSTADSTDVDSGVGVVDPATASWSFEIQFYLGPAGTGAPVHFHGHAMNTLAYGTKVSSNYHKYICISEYLYLLSMC